MSPLYHCIFAGTDDDPDRYPGYPGRFLRDLMLSFLRVWDIVFKNQRTRKGGLLLRIAASFWWLAVFAGLATGQNLSCDLTEYKPIDGLRAEQHQGLLDLTWQGERGEQLRAGFAIRDGQPIVHELAEGDTYMKYPDDETYPKLLVNYSKLDNIPRFEDGWMPALKALRAGDYSVTSGEVPFRNWSIEGTGPHRFYNAEVEWTFPPEFAELVWGDGKTANREIVSLTQMAPLTSHRFRIPFDVNGKKWVRFAVWDSAWNGAFTQPVHLQ